MLHVCFDQLAWGPVKYIFGVKGELPRLQVLFSEQIMSRISQLLNVQD
jgi:hypothetical protein